MKKLVLNGLSIPLLSRKPSPFRHNLRLADEARDARRWAEAAAAYRRVLDLRPDMAPIWVQLGHMLKESGRVEDALTAYETAIGLDPSAADTHLHRGHALKLQGRLDDAAAAYAQASSLDARLSAAVMELDQLGYGQDGRALSRAAADEVVPTLTPPRGGLRPVRDRAGLEDLLARFGLLPHVLPHFDAEFYLAWHGVVPQPGENRQVAAIRHFGEEGIDRLLPVNRRSRFDPAFYAELYDDRHRLSNPDAYRHWLNLGIPRGRAPNMTVWLQDVTGLPVRDEGQIDLDLYRAAVPELSTMPDTAAVEWLVDGGLLDPRLEGGLDLGAIAFHAAAAVRAGVRGELDLSLALMQRVLAQQPLHMPTLQLYADRLAEAGHQAEATLIYRQVLGAGLGGLGTFLHLSGSLAAQHRFREAYETLVAGVAALPQHQVLREALDGALLAFWHAVDREYNLLARAGRISRGQELVAAFCRLAAVPARNEAVGARVIRNVALFAQLDLPQCRFYRVDQKLEHLTAAGFEVTVFDAETDLASFLATARRFDAVIFYRVPALPHVIPAINKARELGAVTFYEIDDLLFLPEEYPGPIEGYAGQINAETYAGLAMGVPLFQAALRMCDYALASTPALAREMACFTRSGCAFVHRNAVGAEHGRWLEAEKEGHGPDEPVTIFYGSGTRAHKEDFKQLLEPALIEVARRHGSRVNFLLVGWLPISNEFRAAAKERLTVVEPVFGPGEYWGMLQEADINLAVLKPSLDADCKSEIKWMEAALLGIPSVLSRTETLAEVVEDGRTGFLCDTVADWTKALDTLLRDPALRRRVGEAARDVTRQDYSVPAMARNMGAILREVGGAAPGKRLKVLVVNVFYPPQLIGGATRVVHDNVVQLSRENGEEFTFEVFCCIDGAAEGNVLQSYVQDGVIVTGITRGFETETAGDLADPAVEAAFRAHVLLTEPDVIHFHCIQRLTLSVVAVAQELGIPYVVTAHDGWWISDHQFLVDDAGHERVYDYAKPRQVLAEQGSASFARMRAMRRALSGAARVLPVSEPFAAVYRRCGVGKVMAVPNGVSNLVPLPRTSRPGGRVRLGFVGGLTRHKGFDLLELVLRTGQFANLELILVDRSKPKGFTQQESWGSVPVSVIGEFGQDEVAVLYAGIDVLVAPSIWAEAYGLVTREALLCGCWVVASDRGAIGTDVTEGVNGFVVDVSDGSGLAAALRRIDADPGRFRQPPPQRPIRKASAQGAELAALYREVALRHGA